jgi:hypothetical protein
MILDQSLREIVAARRMLMAAIQAEETVWRDAIYRRIRERHLDQLLSVMERFEGDLGAGSETVTKSMRRLEQRP